MEEEQSPLVEEVLDQLGDKEAQTIEIASIGSSKKVYHQLCDKESQTIETASIGSSKKVYPTLLRVTWTVAADPSGIPFEERWNEIQGTLKRLTLALEVQQKMGQLHPDKRDSTVSKAETTPLEKAGSDPVQSISSEQTKEKTVERKTEKDLEQKEKQPIESKEEKPRMLPVNMQKRQRKVTLLEAVLQQAQDQREDTQEFFAYPVLERPGDNGETLRDAVPQSTFGALAVVYHSHSFGGPQLKSKQFSAYVGRMFLTPFCSIQSVGSLLSLTSCISSVSNNTMVLLLKQHPFLLFPVNYTGPWYDDKGLQVLIELKKALDRPKRAVDLIIVGLLSLISFIESSTVAAVALTESVQTATYVNSLTQNATQALNDQGNIDEKISHKLNALYDMVMYLGEEVQGLKLRHQLKCHAAYNEICVTSEEYNQSKYSWETVKNHLQGIWLTDNFNKDFLNLHKEILDMQNAELQFDPVQTTQDILDTLKHEASPFGKLGDLPHFLLSIVTALLCLLIMILLIPCVIKLGLKSLLKLGSEIHMFHLKQHPPYGPIFLQGTEDKDCQVLDAYISSTLLPAVASGSGTRGVMAELQPSWTEPLEQPGHSDNRRHTLGFNFKKLALRTQEGIPTYTAIDAKEEGTFAASPGVRGNTGLLLLAGASPAVKDSVENPP
ncbi:Endogenous Retrovirus Group K Member 25 Env Polyprotein [Manis pentadactyla]|nr:Endogenous Retrovirus Group K Member 25 Env Polyprotein [Manis pentadactyla]